MRLEGAKKWCNSSSDAGSGIGGDVMMMIAFIILQYYIFANKEKNIED
jgi:hypothetical protein